MRKKREKQKNLSLMGWIIIILMVSSVFGVMFYGFSSSTVTHKYNNYKFKQVGQTYVTQVNGIDMTFYFLPEQVLTINMSEDILNYLKNGQVFFLMFDPDDPNMQYIDLLRYELAELGLNGVVEKYFIPGITKESEVYNLDRLSCANATMFQPVIYFKSGNATQITMDNQCISFQASYNTDMLRLRDRIMYSLVGVI